MLLPLGVAASPASAPAGAGEGILARCWTAEQLRDGSGGATPAATPGAATVSPLPPIPARLRGVIRSVRPVGDEKLVALTFDLCESGATTSGYDAPLVAYLRTRASGRPSSRAANARAAIASPRCS